MEKANTHYVEHFLNEKKTHFFLPRLTKLKVDYDDLKMLTKNFTRDETRRNCAEVKRLIAQDLKVYLYFLSLSV
jgi:hypothetical protein